MDEQDKQQPQPMEACCVVQVLWDVARGTASRVCAGCGRAQNYNGRQVVILHDALGEAGIDWTKFYR